MMSTTAYGCNTQYMVSYMRFDFEKKLLELGLSYTINNEGFYTILNQMCSGNHIVLRLIFSKPINKQVSGSKNGTEVQAIGRFKFKLPSSGLEPDILVFAFQNPVKNQDEFLIVPTLEFWRRHVENNSKSVRRKGVEMVFWLMQDGFVYDTTNISVEAEWYFLSKGASGRLADRTVLDYSQYWNGWRRLMV